MNKVILIGRITKDPELRRTPTDVPVVQFTIAVNRNYQNKNGERQADFISCVAWRNQAENLARYIKKGGLLGVEGNLQTRTYDDQGGVRRYITEVICDQISFLEPKKNDQNGYNDFNQMPVPPMSGYQGQYQGNQNSYNNNNYQNNYNNSNDFNNSNPFDDIDKAFDISSDDLPF
jgi:single-strand DNA-binding protein